MIFYIVKKNSIQTGLDFSEDAQENSRQFVLYFLTRVVQEKLRRVQFGWDQNHNVRL